MPNLARTPCLCWREENQERSFETVDMILKFTRLSVQQEDGSIGQSNSGTAIGREREKIQCIVEGNIRKRLLS